MWWERFLVLGSGGHPQLKISLCASARDKNAFYIIALRRGDAEVGVGVAVRWERLLLGGWGYTPSSKSLSAPLRLCER